MKSGQNNRYQKDFFNGKLGKSKTERVIVRTSKGLTVYKETKDTKEVKNSNRLAKNIARQSKTKK